jgi:DNA polymerase V
MNHTFIAIDLKSFYASVECADRGLDALSVNLIVADAARTEKTICLAVSPSLKAYGIAGRARLFEVIQRVKEVNAERLRNAIRLGKAVRGPDGKYGFSGRSADARQLAADPSLELDYIIARPRMKLYERISTKVFSIYMKYVSDEDIHVYSVDECFMDVTGYLKTYGMTAHELAMTMIRDVLYNTGITATAGIGTNMYLAKVAMDIVAKHVPADQDGVRIAELDEMRYRELLWCHQPLTDFWRVGHGIARRLEKLGCHTMGDIARLSLKSEDLLYKAFGIGAELLIDHAWGWEPTVISEIRSYRPESNSLSSGQVLSEACSAKQARLIVREMTDLLTLDLVRKKLVTRKLELTVCYDRESLKVKYEGRSVQDTVFLVASSGKVYTGDLAVDFYGRVIPKHAHGTENLDRWTSSTRRIGDAIMELYDRIVFPDLLIRRMYVVAAGLIREKDIPQESPLQLDFFTDYAELTRRKEEEAAADAREKRLQEAALSIRDRFGKNAMLKGMNLEEEGTTIERNGQVGGHRA